MSPRDLLLALVVVAAWGVTSVVIKVRLAKAYRRCCSARCASTLAAIPAVFFVKRPQLAWRWLLAMARRSRLGQFAFPFSAMYVGMPAGLASPP